MPNKTKSQYERRVAAGLVPTRAERDQSDPRRAEARSIRSHRRWRETRDRFITSHPFCCDPLNLHGTTPPAAEEVHHITPLVEAPHRAQDPQNLAPVCTRCHEAIELMHRQGQDTAKLFINFQRGREKHEMTIAR